MTRRLPCRYDKAEEAAEFIIDETFGVPGVGTVVAGMVKKGVICTTSSSLLLGPHVGDASFKPAAIKSIHYKRLPVTKVGLSCRRALASAAGHSSLLLVESGPAWGGGRGAAAGSHAGAGAQGAPTPPHSLAALQVVAGQTAALALKRVRRGAVRKGMVLVDVKNAPVACWEFDADIAILTHATTIQPRYQAVIHCEIVRQVRPHLRSWPPCRACRPADQAFHVCATARAEAGV